MPIIEIKNVSKCFPRSSIPALKEINLSIGQGEILGIVGMSGAGKSTLLRCLVTLEKPSEGQILFKGEDIVSFSEEQLATYRKKIGMVFQNFHLFPAQTVSQNIAYPMKIHGISEEMQQERIDELLKLVHLEEKREAYPASLSGGEKQRIAIARALANRPEILFCDEPTSALDPKSIKNLLSFLKELNALFGITIVLITHQWEVVKEICSNVAVLSKGRLVEQGSLQNVIHSDHINSLLDQGSSS